MTREADTEFLRSMRMSANVTDSEFLSFSLEERDRLYQIAGVGTEPIQRWHPTHAELFQIMKHADIRNEKQVAAKVAAKLTA